MRNKKPSRVDNHIEAYIRSAIYNVYSFIATMFCAIFGMVFLFGSRQSSFRVSRLWEKSLSFGARWILNLDYQVEGRENLPKEGGYIIASKHQSAWETFSYCGIFSGAIFVAKKELSYVPFVGLHFRKQKLIFVNRRLGSHAKADMVRQAKQRIAEGDRIIIFPEGTRTAVGSKAKYKNGIFAMYEVLNVPIIPVALNSGVYWPRRSFCKKPGTITVSILPAIQPGLSKDEFMNQLEKSIETRSAQLAA